MIRHIVFFSAKPERQQDVLNGLKMLADIPDTYNFDVAYNIKADPFSQEVDIVVYCEFTDEAALAAFKTHPIYAACTERVKPLRETRIVADIRASD